jgi:hypothetical protein
MDLVAELFGDGFQLFGGERVRVHVGVHGREKEDGDEGRQGAEEGGLQQRQRGLEWQSKAVEEVNTHKNVVADSMSDLGERVGRAGSDENNVGPSAELQEEPRVSWERGDYLMFGTHLDVQDGVANLEPSLTSGDRERSAPKPKPKPKAPSYFSTHLPFFCVRPHLHSTTMLYLHGLPVEKVQRRLGSNDLNVDLLVLDAERADEHLSRG